MSRLAYKALQRQEKLPRDPITDTVSGLNLLRYYLYDVAIAPKFWLLCIITVCVVIFLIVTAVIYV